MKAHQLCWWQPVMFVFGFGVSSQALRSGVLDVIPVSALENLTAEDLRLLLNGCGEVSVQQLTSYTSFNDETGGTISTAKLLHVKVNVVYTWTSDHLATDFAINY